MVLPAPFGPIRPTRSPRMMRVEKSRTTTRSPYALLTRLGLEHHASRRVGLLDLQRDVADWTSRRAARSARIAISARTRPSSRVRRALTPWRSHTSSCASRLSNFSCCTASFASHSSFFRRNVA